MVYLGCECLYDNKDFELPEGEERPIKKTPILESLNPLWFYLLFAVIAFFPCLFLGQAYFDGDLISYNSLTRQFLRDHLAGGHVPLWNPYLFGGQPFFPDPSVMAAYPLLYPTLLFPPGLGLGVFQLLHFFIAAAGMRYWLKTMELSQESCWVGAATFASSGFFWSEIVHPQCYAVFAWMPWFMGSLKELARRPRIQTAWSTGLFFSLIFLAGYFQMMLGILYWGLGYLIFLNWSIHPNADRTVFSPEEKGWRADPKSIILFLIWGSIPLWFLGIPFLDFMSHFDRWNLPQDYQSFNADFSLNPPRLYQFLFPQGPVDPGTGDLRPLDDILADAGYVGVWAPFLLLGLAFQKKHRPLVFFLAGTASLSLLVALGKYFPLHQWVCQWVPGFRLFRAPFRLIFIWTACLSILSAVGFESLVEKNRQPMKKNSGVVVAAFLYALSLLALGILGPRETRLQFWLLPAGLLGLWLWFQTKKFSKWGKGLFILSIPFALMLSGWHSCISRIGPTLNLDLQTEAPLVAKIREKVGNSRVFVNGHIPHTVEVDHRTRVVEFPTNGAELFQLRNVGGYNPLSLMKWGQLKLLPHQTLFRLMALQGFVTGIPKDKVPDLTPYSWGSAFFYEYKEPLSYVYAPRNMEVIPQDEDQLNAMGQPRF